MASCTDSLCPHRFSVSIGRHVHNVLELLALVGPQVHLDLAGVLDLHGALQDALAAKRLVDRLHEVNPIVVGPDLEAGELALARGVLSVV